MDCCESRAALWPPERPRLTEGGVFEAQEHVSGCPECHAYFEQDRLLLDAYQRLRSKKAPRRVRERVFDALARERTHSMGLPVEPDAASAMSSGRPPARVLTVAAIVVMIASAGTVIMSRQTAVTETHNTAFVEDYLRRAVGQDRLETDDPAEVSRFLMRELGLMIAPARFAGVRLSAVEVCLLDGRRGAMIKYRLAGHEVSHYIVPKQDSERRAPALSAHSDRSGPEGPSVITWSSGMVEQALVADLEADRLLAFARRFPEAE